MTRGNLRSRTPTWLRGVLRSPWLGDAALLAGALALLAACVEWAHPYFFLHDDNRTIALPLYVHMLRGLAAGQLPLYDFHQFMGIPLIDVPCTPFTVLPCASAALSHLVAGHWFLTMEILVLSRLLAGMWGMYALVRHLLGDRAPGLFAALTWPWCSFVVCGSTSWPMVSGVVAVFPWMVLCSLVLVRRPGLTAVAGAALSHALLVYLLYPEYVIYSLALEAMLVLGFAWAEDPGRSARSLLPSASGFLLAGMLALGLSLPALLPFWRTAQSSFSRSAPIPYAAFAAKNTPLVDYLRGLVFPFGSMEGFYSGPGWFERISPYLSFAGPVTLVLVCWLAWSHLKRGHDARGRMALVLAAAFAVMLLLALGAFNPFLYHVPLMNRFRWHFKALLQVQFCLSLLASLGFASLVSALSDRGSRRSFLRAGLILLQGASLAGYYALSPARTFNFREMTDPLPLVEPLAERLRDGRILALGGSEPNFYSASALGFNYATLWRLNQLGGYALLTPPATMEAALFLNFDSSYDRPEFPFGYLRSVGVRWYIARKEGGGRLSSAPYAGALSSLGIRPAFEDARRVIYEDPQARPLAYWADTKDGQGLALTVGTNTLDLETRGDRAGEVVVNFFRNPDLVAVLDGATPLGVGRTELHQIRIRVPAGQHCVTIRYPMRVLGKGALLGLLLVVMAAAGIAWWSRVLARGAGPGGPSKADARPSGEDAS